MFHLLSFHCHVIVLKVFIKTQNFLTILNDCNFGLTTNLKRVY